MGRLLYVLTFVLLLCVAGSAQSGKRELEIRSAILAVMDAQAAAWNRGDVEAFMNGYWKSDQLVFVSGDDVTRGWTPTLERYKKSYDSREKMGALSFTDVVISVLSKDAATVLGSWSVARAKDNPKGKFTLIFRKFKEGWRIVHDHTS
jgi:ketosteroid isomerase-like protein